MTEQDRNPKLVSNDIQAIIDDFNASRWRTLELEYHGVKLFLSKDIGAAPNWSTSESTSPAVTKGGAPPSQSLAAPADIPAARGALEDGQVIVSAPSLGTFYRSPKPGAPPFIQIGDDVEAETELCLIEVMKLFTTLRAGVKGKVTEILIEDGVMVENDQPLFVIDTNG